MGLGLRFRNALKPDLPVPHNSFVQPTSTPPHSIMAEAKISILPLLKALSEPSGTVSPEDITKAITHSFKDELSPVQTGALLTTLHFTKLDQKPEIIAAAAKAMRAAGLKVDGLQADVWGDETSGGKYGGGLVSPVSKPEAKAVANNG